jgi:flagellar basal body-associated protein FliL
MRLSCDVIRDLLPLYAEKMVSDDTQTLVEEHLDACPCCKAELDKMVQPQKLPPDTHIEPFRKAKKKLNTTKVYTAILSVLITLVITLTVVADLTAPQYLPYSKEIVTVSEQEDGTVYLSFSEEVAGYDINRYLTEDRTGYEYSISTWETTWHKRIAKNNIGSIVINPDQENVVSIYYYTAADLSGDFGLNNLLIYGKDLYPNGGVVTLPRLVLGYYVIFSILLLGMLAVLYWVFHKNEKAKSMLEKALLVPVSYLLAHLCVKGLTTTSHSATRDFAVIMLVMFPIYGVLLLASYFIKRYWRTRKGNNE